MNLKKWGSLLTAIAMVGSMAASLPVSAAETTQDTTFKGDLSSHVSYEYNVTKKVITLDSNVDDSEIPNCAYGTEVGIISQITYDHTGETGWTVVPNDVTVVINSANIDSIEEGAFDGLHEDATVKIHCQSDLADVADKSELIAIDGTSVAAGTRYNWVKQTRTITGYTIASGTEIAPATFNGLTETNKAKFTADADPATKYTASEAVTITTTEYGNVAAADTSKCTATYSGWTNATGAGSTQQTQTSSKPSVTDANLEQWVAGSPATEEVEASKEYDRFLAAASIDTIHEMQPNSDKNKHNHVCVYGDKIDNSYAAHTFKANKTTKTHVCDCGKTDADYLSDTSLSAAGNTKTYYAAIHTFDASTHVCSTCGARNEQHHSDNANLTIVSDNNKTHSKTCVICNYKVESEAHDMAVTEVALTGGSAVNGVSIPAHTHYCRDCGWYDPNHVHTYDKVKKPVVDNLGVMTMVITDPSAGEAPVLCACGAIDPKHGDAGANCKYIREDGYHYCLCGREEKNSSGVVVHTYQYLKNDKGQTVIDNVNGVMCECGKVNTTAHSSHNAPTYVIGNKHYCVCGTEITGYHNNPAVFDKINNGKHVCECGLENPEKGHDYSVKYVQVTTVNPGDAPSITTVTSVSDGSGLICVVTDADGNTCNDVKAHEHDYDLYENHVHYCACGARSTEHAYAANGKCACGALKDHTHTLNDSCVCTDPLCGETVHSYVAMKGKIGTHICENCGNKSTDDCNADEIDKVNHKHVCSVCGKASVDPSVHDYGTGCVCQDCGNVNHTGSISLAGTTHTCSRCNKTVAHTFDSLTDKCTLNSGNCGVVAPSHVHAVATFGAAADKCKCDYTMPHVLVPVSASVHKCSNKVGLTECTQKTSEAHAFDATSGFCACGLVNPTKLDTVDTAKTALGTMPNTHTSAYIVELSKAVNDLYAYEIGQTVNGTAVTADTVKLAKDAAAQAEFTALLDNFNKVYADRDNNKAGCFINITVKYNKSTATANTHYKLANETLGGNVGKEVTAEVVVLPGYKFDAWYSDAACTNKIGTETAIVRKLNEGTTTIYANIVDDDPIQVNLPGNVKYKVNGGAEVTLANDTSVDLKKGQTVLIKPNVTGDTKFRSFEDKSGNLLNLNANYAGTVGGANDCYLLAVQNAETIKMNTYEDQSAANSYYIIFTNADQSKELKYFDQIISGGTVDLSAKAPAAPELANKKFAGWKWSNKLGDEHPYVRLKTIAAADVIAGGKLVACYEALGGFKLTVTGGKFGSAADNTTNNGEGFTYGTQVVLTAETQNTAGKYFGGWFIGDTCVSQDTTFTYVVTGNATIEAKYNRDEELIPSSSYTITASQGTVDGVRQVVLTANWAMAAEAETIVETGFVFALADVDKADLTLDNLDSTIRKKTTGSTAKKGIYNYTMNLSSATAKNATVSAVVYVTYRDANGVQHTVYSDNAVKVVK